MWAGFPHTDVLLAHAALLRRSSSLCCPHSRHLHSWHSCLQSFKSSSLSLCLPVSVSIALSRSLALSLLRPLLPCCLETKSSENGDNGERGRGGLTRGGWKRREIRGEDKPAGEWWSLFGILYIFTAIVRCQYPLFTPWLPVQGKKRVSVVCSLHFSKQKRKYMV